MSGTAADSLGAAPLAAADLPAAIAKLAAAPSPAKIMAAKGIAPLRPPDLLVAVYQLAFDADPAVKAAAEAAPGVLPDRVLAPPLGEPLPASVLHFFALRLAPSRVEPLERILYNAATADQTFVALAARLDDRELEIIAQNEARLLRTPAIVEALFKNPQARMSSVNRAVELCARNGAVVAGVPAFDEVARSVREDAGATAPTADASFTTALAADAPVDLAGTPAPNASGRLGAADFVKLKLYEKIRLATLGNAFCRHHLVHDPNRIVALAAISSPRITDAEVIRAATSRTVSEDVLRYIANQREYVKLYPVKLALVNNPKCPLAFSLRFLPMLHAEDAKAVARSKNIPAALALAAKKLTQTRGAGG